MAYYGGDIDQSTANTAKSGFGGSSGFAFDNSGWTVATSSAKATASRNDSISKWIPILAGAALLIWVLTKR